MTDRQADPTIPEAGPRPARRPRWRWAAAPMLAGVLVAAAAVVPRVASAQSAPQLRPISAKALVAKALSSRVRDLSGQIGLTANLGLPDLSSFSSGGAATALSYLSGTHTASVWYGAPGQLRVAVPDGSQETDLIRNGTTAWLWQSHPYAATRFVLPAGGHAPVPAGGMPAAVPPTPDQVATQLLSHLGPSTKVFVTDTAWVADQPVYELGLAPAQPGKSLVADVLIAIDANNGLPLRVEVLAGDAAGPALTLGFDKIVFATPAASNFDFTPPQGAKVTTSHLGSAGTGSRTGSAPTTGSSPGSGPTVIGQGWDAMALLPAPPLGAASKGHPASSAGKQLAGLLASGKTVDVGWGQAKLVSTALVDVLELPDGRLLVGAVTPPVLEAAAARLG